MLTHKSDDVDTLTQRSEDVILELIGGAGIRTLSIWDVLSNVPSTTESYDNDLWSVF